MSKGNGWRHPGRNSSDYGRPGHHDHDRRIYASTVSNGGFYGKGPKDYNFSIRLKDRVCEALYWSPDVDASDIEVTAEDHVIYLNGEVDSRHAKRAAQELVEDLPDVEDVINRLNIRPMLDLSSDKTVARGDEGLFTQESIPR